MWSAGIVLLLLLRRYTRFSRVVRQKRNTNKMISNEALTPNNESLICVVSVLHF